MCAYLIIRRFICKSLSGGGRGFAVPLVKFLEWDAEYLEAEYISFDKEKTRQGARFS